MKIGDKVTHAMGHDGIVIEIAGPIIRVKFLNTTNWVWITDCDPQESR